MISCNLVGGLGNMMFQIAAGYSHSLTVKEDFVVSYSNMSQMKHTPYTGYEANIFRNIKVGSLNTTKKYTEPNFKYDRIPEAANILFGYYQSEKYFIAHEPKVRTLFNPSIETEKCLKGKYGDVSNYTSLHVRRGDYLNLSAHHPTCTIEYYEKALSKCQGNVLVFSDDIPWCKETFQDSRFQFVEGNLDYEDLHLMSMCKNNIIANSSFSWWGAWLNSNPNKVVIAPKIWFGSAINHNTKDLLPQSWITI